jgi:2-oxoisovalerate dehydrogenase E1 component
MHAERVDGYNPLALADAIERKRKILEEGRGPVLLDVVTYRFSGHSPSDASSYRDKTEVDLWRQYDAIVTFRQYLLDNGHADEEQLDSITVDITRPPD